MFYIVSPHIDDAVLSLGGFLFNYARETTIHVLNVFSVSQWTNPSISTAGSVLTKEGVTEMRKDEEKIVSEAIGYHSQCLDFDDLLLRDPSFDENIKREVRKVLLKIIAIDDVSLFPLGLMHPDHMMISQIGFDLLTEGYRIIFYEDQPYVSTSDGYNQKVEITLQHNLDPIVVPIDLHRKRLLMKLYRSQASEEWVNMICDYALSQGSDRPIEKLWEPFDSNFKLSTLS